MRAASPIAWLLALLACEAVAAEKLYDGRPLAAWQERIKALHPTSPEAQAAIPGLTAIVLDAEAPWFTRKQAALTLGRIGAGQRGSAECLRALVQLLSQSAGGAEAPRCWAAKGLALMGPRAAPAGGQLAKILLDEKQPLVQRQAVLEPLAVIGGEHPDALPALIEILQTPTAPEGDAAELREIALEAVVILGPRGDVAVPLLVRILRGPRESASARMKAAHALGAIGPRAESAVAALGETVLTDPAVEVRNFAAEALGKLGPRATPTIALLLEHKDAAARSRGTMAAAKLGPEGKPLVPKLARLRADPQPMVRWEALEALAAIDPAHPQLVPDAIAFLASDERAIRSGAMRLLDQLGPRVASGRDQLTKLLNDPREPVRRSAQRILDRLDANMP